MKIDLQSGIVRSITGGAGSVHAALSRSPFTNTPTSARRKATKRPALTKPRFSPLREAKGKVPDPTRSIWWHWKQCPCMAYTVADWVWIHGDLDRDLWRRAVKKAAFTGYALWMKEAEYCARNNLYMPEVPSVSGGYTNDKVIPGFKYQPPADCIKPSTPTFYAPAHFTWYPGIWGYWYLHAYLGTIVTPVPERKCVDVMIRWHYNVYDPSLYIEHWGGGNPLYMQSPSHNPVGSQRIHVTWYYEHGMEITYQQVNIQYGQHMIPQSATAKPRGYHLALGPWK